MKTTIGNDGSIKTILEGKDRKAIIKVGEMLVTLADRCDLAEQAGMASESGEKLRGIVRGLTMDVLANPLYRPDSEEATQ